MGGNYHHTCMSASFLLIALSHATKMYIALSVTFDHTVCIVNVCECLLSNAMLFPPLCLFLSSFSFSLFFFPAASTLASTVGLSM